MKNLVFGGHNIITGVGSIKYLNTIKASRVMIVTGGRSLFKNGTIADIDSMLEENGIETYIFSGIKENPDTEIVLNGLERMNAFQPEIVIAVGGGSAMDAAKVMTIMYENNELNFDNILSSSIPSKRNKVQLIAIPSTSGTASEVTRAAVITFKNEDLKIGLKSNAFIPDIAILDANLTMTMPDNVVAETGIDALTHAVECYINNSLDDFTKCLAKGAVEGIFKYLPISYKDKTIESRQKIHNYQCIAGLAFANVGLGMAHGISHAFGGKFNIAHGLANAITLPYVLRYNSKDLKVNEKLKELANIIGSNDFVQSVEHLNHILNIPKSFKDAGITKEEFYNNFELLVNNSLKGSTKVNPVDINAEDMKVMLKHIFEGNDK